MLPSCAVLPVLKTFVHFAVPRGVRKRARSCPAELFVDAAITLAISKEAAACQRGFCEASRGRSKPRKGAARKEAARIREEQRKHDLDFLEECRVEKIEQLWDSFVKRRLALCSRERCAAAAEIGVQARALWMIVSLKLIERAGDAVLGDAVLLLGEERVREMMPRYRASCDKYAFRELMYTMFKGGEDVFLTLRQIGVVRERSDCFEFWCAEAPLADEPVMQQMVERTLRASRVHSSRAFNVVLEGETPLAYPWVANMTLERLRDILSETLQLAPAQYKLLHLGKAVRAGKRFADQDIRPGAFLVIQRSS